MVGKRDRHCTTNVIVAVDSRTVSFFSWHFGLAWRNWFTRATQMQTQMHMQIQKQGNTRVNYLNANANANASADARNGKMFIFLRSDLRFTRVNRGKVNAMQTQG